MSKIISPFVSVVIPAHNEEAEITICLNSLLKQSLDKKFYEVIVVDNASTDATANIIKKYPFRYVFEPKKSVVVARQKGADASRGEIIVSADADTKYPRNWLETIRTDFQKDPKIIAVSGWIYYRGTPTLFNMLFGFVQQINYIISKRAEKFPLIFAANFAFKKSALVKIGGYPKHLPELGDQQYLLRKFLKLGKVIVNPKIICFTSKRQLQSPYKNIVVYNGWHRLIGYNINLLFNKEVVRAKPAVRKTTRSQRLHY